MNKVELFWNDISNKLYDSQLLHDYKDGRRCQ